LLAEAGIADTKSPVTVTLTNLATSGGIRIYDFYVKVYDMQTAVQQVGADKTTYQLYQTESALLVSGNIAQLKVYSLSGVLLKQSIMSQLVDTHDLNTGIYIVGIQDKNGNTSNQKFIKR